MLDVIRKDSEALKLAQGIYSMFGDRAPLVHESLSLERFRTAWVRTLVPFRMPREWKARNPRG